MNIGCITCLIFGVFFLMIALIFALLKEKGANLISGFNTLAAGEKKKYDRKKMSTDMRNSVFLWSVVFIAGAVVCFFVTPYAVIPAFVVWLILFLKNVHLDTEKAFGKYKIH